MATATLEKANAFSTAEKPKIIKSPWHESVPDRPEKLVKETWKEQFALISALAEDKPTEENLEEGKVDPTPNNELLLVRVKQMQADGSLDSALGHLAAAHDASKNIDPQIIVQVAQLLCIMNESVYLRDLQIEQKVRDDMAGLEQPIKTAMEKNEKLGSNAKAAINQALKEMDEITKSINEVALAMGLEYVPLCNFSSWGKILSNGPYCGAFYRKPQNGDNGLIVVAFKGTGQFKEWLTDARIMQIRANRSPVRGSVHEGFFRGIFSEFPSEISADERVGKTIPFDLLKKQLWRLTQQTMANSDDKQVPVWITGHSLGGAYATHCWQGLLATARLNPYDKTRTIRDLFTFGSPRVGNKEYARYPNTIKDFQISWRFVNQGDIVTKVPYPNYHHVDRKVVISSAGIELRKNKYESPPESAVIDYVGHLLGITQHGLGSYWNMLREGAQKMKSGSWPESKMEVVPPPYANLATWSLDEYHPQKSEDSESHADSKPSEESVLVGKDRRKEVETYDFADDPRSRFRSVVKIQSMFRPSKDSDGIWTMGTGWLIREDLVVTAGHNVYSNTYGGQAVRIKCWIGYRGREFVSDSSVQHRKALNVVTTASWFNNKRDRRRDVALIQVSAPFEGNLNLFHFISTDTKVNNQRITVVGYPGDQYIKDKDGVEDRGAGMYLHTAQISFDLDKDKGMISYDIDTFGGQSGAPILRQVGYDLKGIGTHCYGAGGMSHLNSGNSIGGVYGNDYEKFRECFSGSEPENPTPIGTFLPNESGGSESEPDDEESFPDGEEGFWDIFRTVAKIGSTALPSAGVFLGPAGVLLGTVAGGVLGSLAESQVESGSPKFPDEEVQDRCIQRAQLAEAALQSVIRLGQSSQSHKVFTRMDEIWRRSYSQQIPHLVDFITPVLAEYGFFIAANNWEKEVQPNPAKRKVLQGEDDEFTVPPPEGFQDSTKAKFVQALFEGKTRRVDGITGNAKSFTKWFKPLIQKAILLAKPLATEVTKNAFHAILKKINKGSPAESYPPKDEQTKSFEHVIRRALMADCALQAIETMDENGLKALKLSPTDAGHEESIIDSIKTRVQKIGPLALDYAKSAVVKYIPILVKQLEKNLNPTSEFADLASFKSAGLPVSRNHMTALSALSAFPPDDTVARFYKDDDNPDAPPIEPRPPAEPRPPSP